jgi:hypothetical protein
VVRYVGRTGSRSIVDLRLAITDHRSFDGAADDGAAADDALADGAPAARVLDAGATGGGALAELNVRPTTPLPYGSSAAPGLPHATTTGAAVSALSSSRSYVRVGTVPPGAGV